MSRNYLTPKAKTRESGVSGDGTFAKEVIKKGELIVIFGGKIISADEWKQLPKGLQYFCLEISDNFLIGPTEVEDLGDGDFTNHSCGPNAGMKGEIFLVAMRDIQPNEEIVFDYGMINGTVFFDMECTCDSKNCRGRITSSDWKIPELQEKYKGYFSPYLQKKIDNLKAKSEKEHSLSKPD